MSHARPSPRRSLRRDRRGAAIVEFTVASMPLLSTFLGFTEAGKVYQGNLVLKHSASVAARAAAVIANKTGTINPQPGGGGGGDPQTEIQQAALVSMGRWAQKNGFSNVTVDVNDQSSEADPYGNICVTVRSTYNCNVPLGGRLVCGLDGKLEKSAVSCHAHQGAKYKPE
jgi:hypothetical protein